MFDRQRSNASHAPTSTIPSDLPDRPLPLPTRSQPPRCQPVLLPKSSIALPTLSARLAQTDHGARWWRIQRADGRRCICLAGEWLAACSMSIPAKRFMTSRCCRACAGRAFSESTSRSIAAHSRHPTKDSEASRTARPSAAFDRLDRNARLLIGLVHVGCRQGARQILIALELDHALVANPKARS